MDKEERNKNIIKFMKRREEKTTANMIIRNVINYLEMNSFSYEELEHWVIEFVHEYNEMMQRKANKSNIEAYIKNLGERKKAMEETIAEQQRALEVLSNELKEYAD